MVPNSHVWPNSASFVLKETTLLQDQNPLATTASKRLGTQQAGCALGGPKFSCFIPEALSVLRQHGQGQQGSLGQMSSHVSISCGKSAQDSTAGPQQASSQTPTKPSGSELKQQDLGTLFGRGQVAKSTPSMPTYPGWTSRSHRARVATRSSASQSRQSLLCKCGYMCHYVGI